MKVEQVNGYGLRSAQPTPRANAEGQLYFVADEDVCERWSGSAWQQVAVNDATVGGDEDWHEVGASGEPAFENSWANYGGAFTVVAFRKLSSGLVVVKGLTTGGGGTLVFTLPSGYRPAETLINNQRTGASDGDNRVDINNAGGIVSTETGSWVSLEMSFYADGSEVGAPISELAADPS